MSSIEAVESSSSSSSGRGNKSSTTGIIGAAGSWSNVSSSEGEGTFTHTLLGVRHSPVPAARRRAGVVFVGDNKRADALQGTADFFGAAGSEGEHTLLGERNFDR